MATLEKQHRFRWEIREVPDDLDICPQCGNTGAVFDAVTGSESDCPQCSFEAWQNYRRELQDYDASVDDASYRMQ